MTLRSTAIALFAAILLAGPAAARDAGPGSSNPAYDRSTEVEDLLTESLVGDPAKEVRAQLFTIPADTTLPWHIHPGAQEIVYIVDGPFVVEVEGEDGETQKTELETGEVFHLEPDAVHRGLNEHPNAAKLYVIRIKPKDAPMVEEVER